MTSETIEPYEYCSARSLHTVATDCRVQRFVVMAQPAGRPARARRRFAALFTQLGGNSAATTHAEMGPGGRLYRRPPACDGPFVAKPYVQLSTAGAGADGREQLTVVWHTLVVRHFLCV